MEQQPNSEFLVKLLTRKSVSSESTNTSSNQLDAHFKFPIALVQHEVAKALRAATITECHQFWRSLLIQIARTRRKSEISDYQNS
jgi:hypothetical protein